MIVELTERQIRAIERQADWEHDRFWRAILDSLEQVGQGRPGSAGNQWRVVAGPDNELAEEVMDAWFEAQDEGEDIPYATIDDVDVQIVGSHIFDHMNYGMAYGFDDDDDDDDDDELDPDTNAVITPSGPLGSRYSASLDGRFVGEYKTEDEAIEALREAAGPNYFPDLIFVDDHGGMRLMDWD